MEDIFKKRIYYVRNKGKLCCDVYYVGLIMRKARLGRLPREVRTLAVGYTN